MKYEVDRINRSLSNWEEPSLKEMTVKAINMLKKSKKGYFLFVEGQYRALNTHTHKHIDT